MTSDQFEKEAIESGLATDSFEDTYREFKNTQKLTSEYLASPR